MKARNARLGIAVFVLSLIACSITASRSQAAALAIIPAGLILSVVIFLLPAMAKRIESASSVKIGPKGVEITELEWKAYSNQPLRTNIPRRPTDSTSDARAKTFCQKGREVVFQRARGQTVDLDLALRHFTQAAALDNEYWEPQCNIAHIYLLKGHLKEALSMAADVRLRFCDNPLAFASAGLIMAKVLELRIPPQATEKLKEKAYERIQRILEDSLESCPGHMTTMTSLGQVLLKLCRPRDEMRQFLSKCLQREDFKEKFAEVLKEEGLRGRFEDDFPGLLPEI